MMACWCALAGTAACKNCSRMKEYNMEYNTKDPLESMKVDPYFYSNTERNTERISTLENTVKLLNDKIDMLLKLLELSGKSSDGKIKAGEPITINESAEVEIEEYVSSDSFPEKPYEGQYWEVGKQLFRYLDGVWVRLY